VPEHTRLRATLTTGCEALKLQLTAAQQDALLQYLLLLMKWNKAFNLSAIRNVDEALQKHLLDSLSVLPYLAPDKIYLDIGSGAGLPGIPLAIALPQAHFVLVDSNGKKTRFLQQTVAQLGLRNVTIHNCRIEQLPEITFDIVMARALATLAQMVQWLADRLGPSQQLLAMKGVYPADEIAELPRQYAVSHVDNLDIPALQAERHLVWVRRTEELQ